MTQKQQEKFIEALKAVYLAEEAKLEEEMKNSEPHVFSKQFEEKMARILNGENIR